MCKTSTQVELSTTEEKDTPRDHTPTDDRTTIKTNQSQPVPESFMAEPPESPTSPIRSSFSLSLPAPTFAPCHSDELGERCKAFYWSRRQRVQTLRRTQQQQQQQQQRRDSDASSGSSRLDDMMSKLRQEMASLLERDLAVMEQMIKMNDAIQDLARQDSYCDESLTYSNLHLADSDNSYAAPRNLKDSVVFKSAPSLQSPETTPTSSASEQCENNACCLSPELSVDSGFEDCTEVF